MAQPSTKMLFKTLSEQMSTRMPENLLSFFVIEVNEFKNAITFKWSVKINKFKISLNLVLLLISFSTGESFPKWGIIFLSILDFANDWCFSKFFRYTLCNQKRSRNKSLTFNLFSIFKLKLKCNYFNSNLWFLCFLIYLINSFFDGGEHLVSVFKKWITFP